MGLVRAAIGDAILTSLWVFSAPMMGILTPMIATYLGVQARSLAGLFITSILATILVSIFKLIGDALGGASFNPSTTVSFYAAGLKRDSSLISMAVQFPAQAAGGVLGAKALLQVLPSQYKQRLRGPSLKVLLHTGVIAEALLTLGLSFCILFIVLRGPKSPLLKVWLLAVATVGLVVAGSGYTGPSMNPANAFGWAFVHNQHTTWDHFYVYWIGPFTGATLAGWIYRFLFIPQIKQKKA